MDPTLTIDGQFISDHLKVACPVIGQFITNWSIALPDKKAWNFWIAPFFPLLAGSRVLDEHGRIDVSILKKRMYLCADSACREFAPLYLEGATETLIDAGLLDEVTLMREHASWLANLEPVTAATAAATILALEEAMKSTKGAASYCIRAARGSAALLAAKNAGWALRCTIFAIKAAETPEDPDYDGYIETNSVVQNGCTLEEAEYLFNTMRANLLHRMLETR